MDVLLPLAVKSVLVAGAALLLLRLAAKRSAAERSWIAHLGLASLLLLPLAALALPTLDVPAPGFLTVPAAEGPMPVESAVAPVAAEAGKEAPAAAASFPPAEQGAAPALPVDWALWAYAAPALVLVLLTLIALGRLITLRARAEVLVEPHWLTALARAQHRMRFKHGTALLTSDELPSPISWGVMRPVILLNRQAAGSHAEAEAIIAHELAHVANLDWAKLLLSRVAVAIFWFNPFVWLLAREAHQLREEAADDAVLGADIVDTDYAQLLVGVARHECRGLLIGAHGVAPGRNSLARRVRRVLDAGSARGPAAKPFAAGVFVGAMAFAAPLAALSLTPASGNGDAASPKAPAEASAAASRATDSGKPYYVGSDFAAGTASATAAATALTSGHPHPGWTEEDDRELDRRIDRDMDALDRDLDRQIDAAIEKSMRYGPRPGTTGPQGRVGPGGRIALAGAASPEYVRSLRSALPQLAGEPVEEFVAMAAVGVSPAYARELASAGYGHLDADDLVEAKAIGINGAYVRSLAAAGYRRLPIHQLVELRAVNVTAADIERFRRAGYPKLSVDQLIKLKVLGTGSRNASDVDVDIDIDVDNDDGS